MALLASAHICVSAVFGQETCFLSSGSSTHGNFDGVTEKYLCCLLCAENVCKMKEKCICCTFDGVFFLLGGGAGKKLEHARIDSSFWSGFDRFKPHARTRTPTHMHTHRHTEYGACVDARTWCLCRTLHGIRIWIWFFRLHFLGER